METILQHRKTKEGIELGFQQEIIRRKNGRFGKNPLSKQRFSNLIIGVLTCGIFVLLGLLYMSKQEQRMVSPIPEDCPCLLDWNTAVQSGGLIIEK